MIYLPYPPTLLALYILSFLSSILHDRGPLYTI